MRFNLLLLKLQLLVSSVSDTVSMLIGAVMLAGVQHDHNYAVTGNRMTERCGIAF